MAMSPSPEGSNASAISPEAVIRSSVLAQRAESHAAELEVNRERIEALQAEQESLVALDRFSDLLNRMHAGDPTVKFGYVYYDHERSHANCVVGGTNLSVDGGSESDVLMFTFVGIPSSLRWLSTSFGPDHNRAGNVVMMGLDEVSVQGVSSEGHVMFTSGDSDGDFSYFVTDEAISATAMRDTALALQAVASVEPVDFPARQSEIIL